MALIKCLFCGGIIDTSVNKQAFLEHLEKIHPKYEKNTRKWCTISMTGLVEKKNKNDSAPLKNVFKPQSKERYVISFKTHKVHKVDKIETRRLYKMTVEKWRPGDSTIVCAECGTKKRPEIISQHTKGSHLATGPACLRSYWPFRVLPCFSPPSTDYLHCSVCGYYLGAYDHQKSVIHPNKKLYLDEQ